MDPKQLPDDELSRLLGSLDQRDPAAMNRLFELLYAKFRAIAGQMLKGEPKNPSLHVTPLISELYLRFAGGRGPRFRDAQHLFRSVATTIRHVLVDLARERKARKRGGGARPIGLSTAGLLAARESVDVLELDDLLEALRRKDERAAAVAELKLFGGLEVAEIAKALAVSKETVWGDWRYARAWLGRRLRED